jgi:hypothetical protein
VGSEQSGFAQAPPLELLATSPPPLLAVAAPPIPLLELALAAIAPPLELALAAIAPPLELALAAIAPPPPLLDVPTDDVVALELAEETGPPPETAGSEAQFTATTVPASANTAKTRGKPLSFLVLILESSFGIARIRFRSKPSQYHRRDPTERRKDRDPRGYGVAKCAMREHPAITAVCEAGPALRRRRRSRNGRERRPAT